MSKTNQNSIYNSLNFSVGSVILLHLVLLALKLIWVTNWSLELHYEEAQYWLWSTKLDWSYYSKPGMVGWMNYLSTAVFGNTVLGVKFPAVLAGFITSLAMFFSAERLFHDRKISVLSSLLLYLMPFYYSVSLFHSTDSFLVGFGAVSFYYFICAIQDNKWKDWLLLGLFLGLAMLSKFTAIIIAGSYGLYLLFYHRNYIPKIIVSGLVMAVTMAPFVIWNFQNDFVSFKHVFGRFGSDQEDLFSLTTYLNAFLEFIGGQLAIISPFLFLFLIKNKLKWNKDIVLTVLPALVSFAFCLLILMKKSEAPNVNWGFFNYPPLAIFFSIIILKTKRLKWLAPIGALLAFLFFLVADTSNLDKIGLSRLITPKGDPTDIYHQWESIAKGAQAKLDEETLLLTDDYKLASAMQFYLGEEQKVYFLGSGGRASQLSYWNDIADIETKGRKVLFVKRHDDFPELLKPQFTNIAKAEKIPVIWRGETIKNYHAFKATANTQLQSIIEGY